MPTNAGQHIVSTGLPAFFVGISAGRPVLQKQIGAIVTVTTCAVK
jgi:hypothetical protein